MAIQAQQYPSNVLPFHRSEPEMKKTTATGFVADAHGRQLQGGHSGFLEQQHALFFPGVGASNPNPSNNNDISSNNYNSSSNHIRKRARDAAEGGGGGGGGLLSMPPAMPTVLPLSCDQQHPSSSSAMLGRGLLAPAQPMLPQVVMTPSLLLGGAGLSQLHPQQQRQEEVPISVVSTGLRLSLEDQPQQQPPQQRHSTVVPPLSDELAAVVKQHREEIDRYLLVQAEHLRRSIAESRRRQLRSLVSAAEESASRKLREKQSELDRASRTRSDLEARAARLAAEAAAWQAKARAGEVAAAALRSQLDRAAADQQAQAAFGGGTAAAEGGATERGVGSDAASACVDPRREEMERQAAVTAACAAGSTSSHPPPRSPVSCKQCGFAGASVVLLPCRHLCLCASCSQDATLPAVCPVCFCARSVAVEVFFC